MGDFSGAFNTMVEQLAEREKILDEKVKQIQEESEALEQVILLLTTLVRYVTQQIFVVGKSTNSILFTNDIASNELRHDADYLKNLMYLISNHDDTDTEDDIEITYKRDGDTRYFMVSKYSLKWHNEDAEVYSINDITNVRREIADLETHVYRDSLTNLYNRAYGMMILELWLQEKRRFSLVFVDLDNLKYVNDVHGHSEGDIYIIRTGEYLQTFSSDALVCRIGGDEFMVLASGFGFDDTYQRMIELAQKLRDDDYTRDKGYTYNMSFGIASVNKDVYMPMSDVLGAADLRMYDNKQRNKLRARQARQRMAQQNEVPE